MLDIEFIRNNPDVIKDIARKRGVNIDIVQLLQIDKQRRELITNLESKRAEQNNLSSQIAGVEGDERQALIDSTTALKTEIKELEFRLEPIEYELQILLRQVPNIPDRTVPDGKSADDNEVEKTWGQKPDFEFETRDHIELLKLHNMVDFDRGTKVHGFRGYFLKNDGARLSWALWNYARDFYQQFGFQEFLAPAILREDFFFSTGHLPAEADDLYSTQDDDRLSGTAEVPMMAYYADEIINYNDLPFKALAFSPCYRREAGSHSKDTKGLIRVHEFYKLEQVVLCEANNETSADLHQELNGAFEQFIETLQIPYQRLNICLGDLSNSKVKQYDIEAWVPSQQQYRELSSASYFHDFQTRRFNIRYRSSDGEIVFAHSLNNTAVATPRILVPLIENHQNANGSITIPDVLMPYFGKSLISNNG